MNLVLLGAPGAGKGTQAKLLCERLGLSHLSTGDMLRAARESGTAVGREVAAIMDAGQLVSDDVVMALLQNGLRDATKGAILDGFPRNLQQANRLEQLPTFHLDHVVSIDVPVEALVERLSGRRSCLACGAAFHVAFSPPEREGICDSCGAALVQRADDREEAIRKRLEVYEQSTRPLVDHYSKKGLLRAVHGTGEVGEVTQRIVKSIGVER